MENIKLPEGWHIQKSGGRPRQDAKFVGVVLARFWRVNHLGEKKHQADEWILKKWEKHGITDEAHIRTIVRNLTKGITSMLRRVAIVPLEDSVLTIPARGKKGWYWDETMTEAIQITSNVSANLDAIIPNKWNFEVQLQEVDKTHTG